MEVFFATPAYDSTVHVYMAQSLMDEVRLLREKGIESHWEVYSGCCYLPISRNMLVKKFLESGATDLFFVDADIQWNPGAALKLLEYDRDIVAGLYPYKTGKGDFPMLLKSPLDGPAVDKETGLIEVEGTPTGFMRIRHRVFDIMIARFNDLEIEDHSDPKNVKKYWRFFDTVKEGKTWWGEDLWFCRRWRELGGQIWVEANINFTHHGLFGFQGNFLDYVANA